MSRFDKLIERLQARPPEADFGDIQTILEAHGWTLDRTRGSHHVFTRTGYPSFSVPTIKGRRVKRIYINKMLELIGLDETL